MNEALVVILVFLWAVVLLPGAWRSRRSSPASTVGGFERAMAVLHGRKPREASDAEGPNRTLSMGARGGSRALLEPGDAARLVDSRVARQRAVIARRRRVFEWLAGSTGTLALLAMMSGGAFTFLFVVALGSLISYVAFLRRLKAQQDQAARVVRELPLAGEIPVSDEGELLSVASAGAGLQIVRDPSEPWDAPRGVRIRKWDT